MFNFNFGNWKYVVIPPLKNTLLLTEIGIVNSFWFIGKLNCWIFGIHVCQAPWNGILRIEVICLAYWCISFWVNPLALFSVVFLLFSICLLVSVVSADKSFEDFLVPLCYSYISKFSCLPLAECGFSCGQNSVRPSVGAIKWFKWSKTRPSLPAPSSSKSCEYFHILWIFEYYS